MDPLDFFWCVMSRYGFLAPCVGEESLLGQLSRRGIGDFNHYVPISRNVSQYPLYGRILQHGRISIDTVAELPLRWYRVVSNGSYKGGLRARGYADDAFIGPSEINFQICVERHFEWRSRFPSLFLSVTNNSSKASQLADSFLRNGQKNVEILEIDPRCPDWNYDVQLIWDASKVIEAFGLEHMPYNNGEFLIECSIPENRHSGQN